MVRAVELDRARGTDLREWALRRRREPRWRLTETEAAGGFFRGERRPLSTAQVLRELGAELRAVGIEGSKPQ